MKPAPANLLNALVLIGLGIWGYFSLEADARSFTALIPAAFGVVLLGCTSGIRSENKVIAHVAVTRTLLVLIALAVKPLPSQIAAGDNVGIVRVAVMMLTSLLAMIAFIRSFIAARRAREAAA